MSGYFGALMRASGLAIAGGTPLVAPHEPAVAEIDVEHGLAPPPTVAPAASRPQAAAPAGGRPQAAAPGPVTGSAKPVPPGGQPVADAEARDTGVRFPGTKQAVPRAHEAPAIEPQAAQGLEPSKSEPGQALIRAAMQWVAATDSDPVHGTSQAPPRRGPSSLPARDDVPVVTPSPGYGERLADTPPAPANATSAVAPARHAAAREAAAVQAPPIRSARSPAVVTPDVAAPQDRDEVVEVSIGAIHVRVDAPAAQTVAAPPALAQTADQRDRSAPPGRRALARRALRRV